MPEFTASDILEFFFDLYKATQLVWFYLVECWQYQ